MGLFEEAKGKLKQAAGEIVDNPDLVREGKAQEEKGEAEAEAMAARAEAEQAETEAAGLEAEQEVAERTK